MAILCQAQCFVLNRKDLGESDSLFSVFSKEFGKIEISAKGIRKSKSKLSPNFDIFSLCKIEFIQGKNKKILTDSSKVDCYLNIQRDLEKVRAAFKISKAIELLIKGQEPDLRIWDLLKETFENLDSSNISNLAYYYFLWNLLSVSGYKLDLYNCPVCRKKLLPKNLCFDIKEKSITDCQKTGFSLSPETIKLMRLFLNKDWKTLFLLKSKKEEMESLERFSDCFLSLHI